MSLFIIKQKEIKMYKTNEALPVNPIAKNFLPAMIPENNPIYRLSDPSIIQVKKLSPWQKEDLSRIYNMDLDRERREPRLLKKYGLIGNLSIVTAHKLSMEKYHNYRKYRITAIEEIREFVDIPLSTFKTKLSQLNSSIYGEGEKQEKALKEISYELWDTYNKYKDIDYNELLYRFKYHKEFEGSLEEEFEHLRKNYHSDNFMSYKELERLFHPY